MNVIDGYMFEKYVAKIFEEAGYSVELEKRLEDRSGDIDIIAEKEAKRYCIEVKFSRIIDKAVERICFQFWYQHMSLKKKGKFYIRKNILK